ncbi:MAG: hypothetical protein QM564_10490 [Bergeyella sp.]
MRNFQLIGVILVIIGSFLPLVHIPVIGNWNYYNIDEYLAVFCWILCLLALIGIAGNKSFLIKVSAILLIMHFIFTIIAVKFKSLDFFSFLPFNSWKEFAAGMVKLKWGWLLEFSGAGILLFSKKNIEKM